MSRTYDAIVVGAGSNGLTLAIRLQRAGLSTLVIEGAGKIGGMTRTEEVPAPGYRHNPHANFLSYVDISPVIAEFDLVRHGLRTVTPDAQHGIAFSDGRPPIVLHRNDLVARSVASISRYSRRDAEAYAALKSAAGGYDLLLRDGLFRPASRAWFQRQSDVIEQATRPLGVAGLGQMTSAGLIDALFETPELRALLYQLAAEFGVRVNEPGGAISFAGLILWLVGQWRLPVGGMQGFADALHGAAREAGVEVMPRAQVVKIDVLNGRARSVFVSGQGRIIARRLVASSAGLAPTLLNLVGAAHLTRGEVGEIRAFDRVPTTSLGGLVFALTEAPRYRSARWDPDIDRCFHTLVGFDTPEDVLGMLRDVEAGLPPAPATAIRVNSLWDPSQAPIGRHLASSDVFMPPVGSLAAEDWRAIQASYNQAFLERWADFAPNMTANKVVGDVFEIPTLYERKMRFREGTSQYRTEVAGLYICGASTYPGGGAHGACGYNAFAAIAEDLGLVEA